MFLQEEYLKRHNIEDVPIINYVTKGSLLLRMDSGYLLKTIEWKESTRHPGTYFINYHTPVHDGYAKSRYFNKISDVEREIEWDEYQAYISSWARGTLEPVCGDKEVILAIWEIFIFCCDGMLVDFTDSTLEKLIYKCVDSDSSIDQRFQGYQECLVYAGLEFPALLKTFKHDLLPHVQHYCYWLANLIKFYNKAHT